MERDLSVLIVSAAYERILDVCLFGSLWNLECKTHIIACTVYLQIYFSSKSQNHSTSIKIDRNNMCGLKPARNRPILAFFRETHFVVT